MGELNRDRIVIAMGKRITAARKRMGFTPERFASLIGMSRRATNRWEHGIASIPSDILPTIAVVLRVTVEHLIYGAAAPAVAANDVETKDLRRVA